MKYRICPVCDQKMKSAHYCSNCRAWVKNPWVREVDYYLNERHPAGEKDCSFHGTGGGKTGAPEQGRRTGLSGSGQTYGGASGQGAAPGSRTAYGGSQPRNTARYAAAAGTVPAGKGTYTHVAGGSYGAPAVPKAQSSPKRLLIIAMVIFLSLSVLIQVGSVFMKLMDNTGGTPERDPYGESFRVQQDGETGQVYEDVDLGVYEADEYWYEELTDEEALAAGTACNGMNHFAITGKEMEDLLRAAMEIYGYEFTKVERHTENGRNGDDYCWYESTTVMKLRSEEEYADPYIEINCDTVTGELHWVDIDLENREHIIEFVRLVLVAMEEKQPLDPDGNLVALFDADLVPLIEKTESFDYILGGVELYGTQYSDVYSISILPSP